MQQNWGGASQTQRRYKGVARIRQWVPTAPVRAMPFQYCIHNHTTMIPSIHIFFVHRHSEGARASKETLSQVGVCLCMPSCGIRRKPMPPKIFLPPNCLMQHLKRLAVFPLKSLNISINYCDFVPSDTHLIYITLLFYLKP